MKKIPSSIASAMWWPVVSLAIGLLPATSHAGKPGGGNVLPPGLIYYQSASVSLPGSAQQMFSMKADGSQKTPLGISYGSPGAVTHGGTRWYLRNQQIPGQINLAGGTRSEVFAVREDGSASVQLTDDPAMTVSLDWTPVETASSAVVAGLARRWNADGTLDPASLGVYAATLRFDAAGNVTGLDGPPAFMVSVGVIPNQYGGTPIADCSTFSFSPDMTRLVADHAYYSPDLPLRIVNVATGVETFLVAGPAHSPVWSPNGAKIAFRSPNWNFQGVENLDVISPNGTGRASVIKTRSGYLHSPQWSPDSSFMAYTHQDTAFSTTEIYRASATGAPNVFNLNAPNASATAWR